MALGFPNDSRNYDAAHATLSFWGYDSAFEVTFRLGETVLRKLTGLDRPSEVDILRAFDAQRSRIREVAAKLYGRSPKRNWDFAVTDI